MFVLSGQIVSVVIWWDIVERYKWHDGLGSEIHDQDARPFENGDTQSTQVLILPAWGRHGFFLISGLLVELTGR
jgi:hypothetical protein